MQMHNKRDGMKYAERESSMLVEHRHHSARAKCAQRGQILHIDYSGPIDLPTTHLFDGLVLPSRMACISSFERMDRAMTMFTDASAMHSVYWPG